MGKESKTTISAVVLVKNHRRHIKACLETLRWVDEVVIVNDNSSDGTIEIAKQYDNVAVYDRALGTNWTLQRNFGIDKSKGDWIMQVDVDHRITGECADEITKLIADTPHNAIAFKYTGIVLGRVFGDDANTRPIPMLIRKGAGRFGDQNQTHTNLVFTGSTGICKEPVIHLGPYLESNEFFSKNIFYAETEAKSNVAKNTKIPPNGGIGTLWWFIIKPGIIFLQKFIGHGYWKRGLSGFHYAMLRAIGYYMVYLRTWELRYNALEEQAEISRVCKARNIPLFLD